ITMSYVEGADLASLLRREGTLAVPKVLRIARSVASGLVAAHRAGVVHRDLKPANIMIDADDEALIMDFGIARSIAVEPADGRPAGGRLGEPLPRPGRYAYATLLGTVIGTVEYMAPEQARCK